MITNHVSYTLAEKCKLRTLYKTTKDTTIKSEGRTIIGRSPNKRSTLVLFALERHLFIPNVLAYIAFLACVQATWKVLKAECGRPTRSDFNISSPQCFYGVSNIFSALTYIVKGQI